LLVPVFNWVYIKHHFLLFNLLNQQFFHFIQVQSK
jgi:hypothetical protein